MRASKAASTRGASTPCASAASEETGTTGISAPKASPWATPAPMRSPVNDPGPRPKAIASRRVRVKPVSASSSSTMARMRPECCGPVSKRSTTSPSFQTATEQASGEASGARSFKFQTGDSDRHRPGVVQIEPTLEDAKNQPQRGGEQNDPADDDDD